MDLSLNFIGLHSVLSDQDQCVQKTQLRFTVIPVSARNILYSSGCVVWDIESVFNPLNPELNPICYLLALLGAHHSLHVSRIRVKLLTFRRLMS